MNGTKGNGTPTPTPTATPTPTVPPGKLWYNGDFDGTDGLANEQDTFAQGYSHIYDDFIVNDESGWDVTSVFSDDLISTTVTGATWEIRQGISNGNGGTLVASGMTATPSVTPTGRSGFGFTEFMVEVGSLNVHLDPGTYYLNVTPIGNLDGNRSFNSTTSGANCIGTPCGNDNNSWWDSPVLFGVNFVPASDAGAQFHDFSMGVNGMVGGGGGGDLTLTSAASTAGGFSVPLPTDGSGIEPRNNVRQTVDFTFNNNITDPGTASISPCGTVGAVTVTGNVVSVKVNVAGCNEMTETVTLTGVMDDQGNSGDFSATYGVLFGDVTGNGTVDNADILAIRANLGAHVNSTNFRDDLNATDGSTNGMWASRRTTAAIRCKVDSHATHKLKTNIREPSDPAPG